jgi:hypothetical protein
MGEKMRLMILGVCLFAAACGGRQALNSPTSPTGTTTVAPVQAPAVRSAAPMQALRMPSLPFRGSFKGEITGTLNCPPTCPPTIVTVTATLAGTATHLGQFTATRVDVADLGGTTATGTFNLTAANGDQLFSTTSGGLEGPPHQIVMTATIVGGTGRFVHAGGTFTARLTQIVDFASGTGSETGTFEGEISLDK